MSEPIYYLAQSGGHEERAETVAEVRAEESSNSEGGAPMPLAPNLWIYTALAFAVVFFVLKKYAIPRIMEGLDKRSEQIEGDLKKAELTREEADKLLAEYKAQLEEARTEAKKVIDDGKALGENLRQQTVAKAQEEASQMISRAREEIGREKEKAIKELRSQIAEISIEVAAKVIQKTLSKEEHGELIDDYIAEVGKLYEG